LKKELSETVQRANSEGHTNASPTLQEIEDMGLPEDKQLLLETILKLRKDMWSEKSDATGNPLAPVSIQSNLDALHMKGGSLQSSSGSEQELQHLDEGLEIDESQELEDERIEQQSASQKGRSSNKEE